jgi:hypothetical protein|tara:strand:- start:35217 stop:35318 length:102 start_codon:yes stop_codon:yes gene_type:complete
LRDGVRVLGDLGGGDEEGMVDGFLEMGMDVVLG